MDSSILNDPSFRAAGWSVDHPDIKRTYSPPIPTAVASDYFTAPPRSAGFPPPDFNDEEEEGGMVTGRGSNDTVGPGPILRRRRQKEQHDDDDSSDLSDDSDEEDDATGRAAQQIKFAKMPSRTRADSSPLQGSKLADEVDIKVISPSRRSTEGRLRGESFSRVEAVKQRARRDTATSSDLSSENELDPAFFQRRQIKPRKAPNGSNLAPESLSSHGRQNSGGVSEPTATIDEDSGEDLASSLSSGFDETADSESLMDELQNPMGSSSLIDMKAGLPIPPSDSPRKPRIAPTSTLQALPPPRPISTIIPGSLLGQAIKASSARPSNPIERYAKLSGKGVPNPLFIKIFAPFSQNPGEEIEMPIQRVVQDDRSAETIQVKVVDAIGLALWRYQEDNRKPSLKQQKLNPNRWALRLIEDGEVDYDFPALGRTRPIGDFTSNNNRPPRGRSREKPHDDFALIETSEAQYLENRNLTPQYEPNEATSEGEQPSLSAANPVNDDQKAMPPPSMAASRMAGPFSQPTRKPGPQASRPIIPTAHSTPRMGPPKLLNIHFTSLEAYTQMTSIEVTTDTYLAEVLETVCKRWKLDKGYHILKVAGTNTIAPVDRTVESLGTRTDLDLIRRRFVGEGTVGLFGSPGTNSPNAPLFLQPETPKKSKGAVSAAHPLATKQDSLGSSAKYRKYSVIRKQPISLAPSQPRVIMMDEDYVHILPPEKHMYDPNAKTTRIPYNMIVGCKVSRRHPKIFRVCLLERLVMITTHSNIFIDSHIPRKRNQKIRLRSTKSSGRRRDHCGNHQRHRAVPKR